jgi:hypothetical protein
MAEKRKSKKPVPTNPSLWKKSLAEAKSKYKVHPSAYSNSYAAKRYKEMGGKWK